MLQRKLNRLSHYDYSSYGAYFITICTRNRINVFGNIKDEKMILNEAGKIVDYCWNDLINHYKNIKLDKYVIMPNHFHAIIWLVGNGLKPFQNTDDNPQNNIGIKSQQYQISINNNMIKSNGDTKKKNGLKPFPTKTHGIPEIIRGFKTFSSRRINKIINIFRWQKSYYDRIIRNEKELNNIRRYIIKNPTNWGKDEKNKT